MSSQRTLVVLTAAITMLWAHLSYAQVPATPAGRQLTEWLRVRDTLDRSTMQAFIEKNLMSANVDGMLANQKQTGGFDIKRVQESSDTRIAVVAQARITKQFVIITLNVAPTEPHIITSIQMRPTEPPADLVDPTLTPDR